MFKHLTGERKFLLSFISLFFIFSLLFLFSCESNSSEASSAKTTTEDPKTTTEDPKSDDKPVASSSQAATPVPTPVPVGNPSISFATGVVTGGVLAADYGVQFNQSTGAITSGKASFPELKIGDTSSDTTRFVLVYQDETAGSKNWGHGIWIVEKSITTIPKKDGDVSGGKNAFNFVHGSLAGITGIEVVERYFAPTPPSKHTYAFYLFSIGNGLDKAAIKTELDKVKSRASFSGIGANVNRNAPSGVADRVARIKELLGKNIIGEAKVSATYPN